MTLLSYSRYLSAMHLSFFTCKMGMIIIELTHEVIVRRWIGVNKQCLEHSTLYLTVWYYDYFIFILMIVKLLSSTEQGVWYNRLGPIIQMNSVLHCITWKLMPLPHTATSQRDFRFFSFVAACSHFTTNWENQSHRSQYCKQHFPIWSFNVVIRISLKILILKIITKLQCTK